MSVTVSYPGVYIDEVSSGVHTITSVSTSIAAFLGRTSKGKLNKATRCLSPSDFTRNFGAPHPQSDLGHAVRQFFANGGTDCYVVRLAKNAKTATITLRSLAGAAQPVLVATAKAEGLWANQVRLEVDYNTPTPHETFNLKVIQEDSGVIVASETHINLSMDPASPRFAPSFVKQSSEIIDLEVSSLLTPAFYATAINSFDGFSQSRRPLDATLATAITTLNQLITPPVPALPALPAPAQTSFNISVNGSAPQLVNLSGWTVPATTALIESELKARIDAALMSASPVQTVNVNFSLVAGLGHILTITASSGDKKSVRITRAGTQDISATLMLGHDQGGYETARFSNFRPAPTATLFNIGAPGAVTNLNALTALAQNAFTQITIGGIAVQLTGAPDKTIVTTAGAQLWHRSAAGFNTASGDNDGVREKLQIMAKLINAKSELAYTAQVWGYQLAIIGKPLTLNAVPAAFLTTNAAFDGSLVANLRRYSLGVSAPGLFSTGGVDGDDGIAPTPTEYFGDPIPQTGFHALDPVDLFNLMVLPADEGLTTTDHQTLWGPASNYCASRRAFLLVDAPSTWTGTDGRPAVVGNVNSFLNPLNVSVKTHSAVFYPRLVFDDAGLKKKIGPSGAIAGLMARTDGSRGVWKAPAGVEADIRNVLGVEVNLTDGENGVLNKKAVNCIRVFPNGLVNWGARTLAGDDDFGSEWKYIPIRRLALNIEESLFRGTKWVVFEPNDEPLWAKIRLNLNAYMMSLFRQGAFQGTSPKEAFYVKCDKETTTQDDRNKGIVNIEVGFAPLKPAEFVVIKIQQIAGDL
ncbi:MAG: phage tail sheath family protein [Arenimonas sp.]